MEKERDPLRTEEQFRVGLPEELSCLQSMARSRSYPMRSRTFCVSSITPWNVDGPRCHFGTAEDGRTLQFSNRGSGRGTQSRHDRRASSGLDRMRGDHWIAVGDAALAFDPLSSKGISNALYIGLCGARADLAVEAGDLNACAGFQRHVEGRYLHSVSSPTSVVLYSREALAALAILAPPCEPSHASSRPMKSSDEPWSKTLQTRPWQARTNLHNRRNSNEERKSQRKMGHQSTSGASPACCRFGILDDPFLHVGNVLGNLPEFGRLSVGPGGCPSGNAPFAMRGEYCQCIWAFTDVRCASLPGESNPAFEFYAGQARSDP